MLWDIPNILLLPIKKEVADFQNYKMDRQQHHVHSGTLDQIRRRWTWEVEKYPWNCRCIPKRGQILHAPKSWSLSNKIGKLASFLPKIGKKRIHFNST